MTTIPKLFIFTIFFILNLSLSFKAYGVLPPEIYEQRALSSAIKAVAVIEEVEIVDKTDRSTFKKVLFGLEKAFCEDVPKKFSGFCYSVDHEWQNPGMGGTIHYYPRKGKRVLVTVTKDGGSITSFTNLSPELKKALNDTGLKNILFRMGRAVIKEKILAREYFIKGRHYFAKKDYVEAFRWYEKTAQQNDPKGNYYLGVMYANGLGTDKDLQKAYECFFKSGNLGYAKAQYNVGVMLKKGMVRDKDFIGAFKWFLAAAEQNLSQALYVTGYNYEYGEGIQKDMKKAIIYYKKAADGGDKNAIERLSAHIQE